MSTLANISKTQKLFVMLGVMLALLLAALDQTIVATAMPKIVEDLHGLEHLSWVFTAYLLSSTVVVPIYGKLSDIYGRKYFILLAIVIFLIGSALSGFAQNMFQLILFRAIQGLGGGAIFANAFATIGDLFPPVERGKWQGLFGAVFGLSSVVGPTLGGFLTDNISWRWTFFINMPVGVLALLVVFFLMPKIIPDVKNRTVDYLGSLFLSITLVSFLLALVWGGGQYAWASVQIISLLIGSLLSGIIFIYIEKKVKEPVLPLDLFKSPVFLVSIIVIFLTSFAMFGAILYVPLFAQLILGINATNSGTILTPMTLSIVAASVITGQIVSRVGKYKWISVIGLFVGTLGMYLLSQINAQSSQSVLVLRMILIGLGLGVTFPIYTLVVQNAFEHARLGVVTASTQLFRSIGGTVGTAVLGGILNASLAEKLKDISSDPFVKAISSINPNINLSKIDANQLQAFLTGGGRVQLESKLSQLPPDFQLQVVASFHTFLFKVKDAFASSISQVFFIATVIMVIAFVASFFLKELPLRKSHSKGLEESGKELAAEDAVIPSRNEPSLL